MPAPAWVLTDSVPTAAVMDLDYEHDRYYYQSTEYLSYAAFASAASVTAGDGSYTAASWRVPTQAPPVSSRTLIPMPSDFVSTAETWVVKYIGDPGDNRYALADNGGHGYFQLYSSASDDDLQVSRGAFLFISTSLAGVYNTGAGTKFGYSNNAASKQSAALQGGFSATSGTVGAAATGALVLGAGPTTAEDRAAGDYKRVTMFAKKVSDADLATLVAVDAAAAATGRRLGLLGVGQ